MTTGFQTRVNTQQAPAVAGDFASANPRASVVTVEGGLVAGVGGVTVGKFAWVNPLDGTTVHSYGTAPAGPNGFVGRSQQALIQNYLAESGNNIPVGFGVTLFDEGEFFATITGSTASLGTNQAVYADYATGNITIGSASVGASVTALMGSTSTGALGATFTASADSDPTRLVVTAVTGLISIGDTVSGTGITAGTTISSQVSGTTGGAGTYQLSASNTASSATVTCFGSVMKTSATTGLISVGDTVSGGAGFPVAATVVAQTAGTTGGAGTYTLSAAGSAYTASATGITTFGNVLDVTAIGSGTLAVGMPVSGSGIPASALIATQVSGTTGGVGIYTLTQRASAYAASTTVTAVAGVLTNFIAKTIAAVGELVKISTWGKA